MAVGIVGYGTYIPRLRISGDEFRKVWGSYAGFKGEKSVLDFDEDVLTMGIEAARAALCWGADLGGTDILTWASTNFPYAEKTVSGTTAAMLGLKEEILSTEHGQSTRAGSEAMLSAAAYIEVNWGNSALVICSDDPRGQARDRLDHGAGAGAAAFLLGRENVIAEIEGHVSFSTEMMGERFRPAGSSHLSDIGVRGFTASFYNELVSRSIKGIMSRLGRTPQDYAYIAVHEIDERSSAVALKSGFEKKQLAPALIYEQVGDTGAASGLLSLCAVLEKAGTGDRILVVSYGSGAGSQAISLKMTSCPAGRRMKGNFTFQVRDKRYIGYSDYLKLRGYI